MMFQTKVLTLFALLCANVPSSKSQGQPWTPDFNLIKFYTMQSTANLSELCRKQSDIYYNSLMHKIEMWSYKMIDASSKLQSGFLSANFAHMGHFDQCLAVDYKVESIRGKFCYTKIKIPLSIPHKFWETDMEHIEPEIYNAVQPILVATIWLLTAVVMLFIVFGNYKSLRDDYVRLEAYEAIFIGLHRNVWGLAICWIIFACLHGYGGPVNWFLSLPMFQIFAKLTYSIYLLHYAIQAIRTGNVRINGYFSNMAVLFSFFGTTCITVLLAIIWVLTFEYPFAVIANLIISAVGELKNRYGKSK